MCILQNSGCDKRRLCAEVAMSFALYLVGIVILIGGLVYVAVLTHVHTQWIVAMVVVLVGAGLMAAVNNTRQRDSK
jgi:peptidoglycan/LPS O-acetylase OafA/YrhL